MAKTHFDCVAFSNVLVFVSLSYFNFFSGVNLEMGVGYYDFFVEVIDLFLLKLGKLFDHVITRDKHCVEIFTIRESGPLSLDFGLEVRLSVLSWNILEAFKFQFSFQSLLVVRDRQAFDSSLVGSLWVLVPILSLHNIVEPTLSLPSTLIFLFGFLSDLILIDYWESKTKMLSRICVELSWVFGDLLSQLLFLELPNIQLLVSILEHINSVRNR